MLDGKLQWLCDECPTPEEIRAARDQIRDGWSESEEWLRAGQPERGWEVEVMRDDRGRVRPGSMGI